MRDWSLFRFTIDLRGCWCEEMLVLYCPIPEAEGKEGNVSSKEKKKRTPHGRPTSLISVKVISCSLSRYPSRCHRCFKSQVYWSWDRQWRWRGRRPMLLVSKNLFASYS